MNVLIEWKIDIRSNLHILTLKLLESRPKFNNFAIQDLYIDLDVFHGKCSLQIGSNLNHDIIVANLISIKGAQNMSNTILTVLHFGELAYDIFDIITPTFTDNFVDKFSTDRAARVELCF